nr:novel protein similar to MHC class II alpha chain [Danio rerio]
MELYVIVLTFIAFLSSNAEFVREEFEIYVCSDTESEAMVGADGEELWHADFKQKTGIITLPDFADRIGFPGFYEISVDSIAGCKRNLANNIRGFKSPPPAMDAPHSSVYPKDDVELGVQNSLICHATGFYPPSITISWKKNNNNVTESINLSQYRPRADGSFNIFSTLKFTPAEGDIYSCTVNHEALQGQAQTKTWDVDVALPSAFPAVVCGVGVVFGLLGIAAGTFLLVKGNCN